MAYKTLPKEKFTKTIQKWMKQYEVVAPVRNEKHIGFEPVSNVEEIVLNSRDNSIYPPKSYFLPQSETLFSCRNGRCEMAKPDTGKRLLLGIRPCDSQAFWLLDHVFMEKNAEDLYWADHRNRTMVISFACDEPCSTCFCTSVGGSPFNEQGSDVQIVEVDGDYLLKSVTAAGRELLAELPDAPDAKVKRVKQISAESTAKIEKQFDGKNLDKKMYAIFEDGFWQDVAQSCLSCGVCTFLCPTCYCFDIVDEVLRGERVRNWDTCMFKIYSQEASGHNPRPTKAERTRQRIMHKFAYWVDAVNEFGCTGCGRCVVHCPVNIDIRQIVRAAEALEVKPEAGK